MLYHGLSLRGALRVLRRGGLGLHGERARWWAVLQGLVFLRHELPDLSWAIASARSFARNGVRRTLADSARVYSVLFPLVLNPLGICKSR